MPLLEIVLRVVVVKLAEVFQRCPDGFVQLTLSHEDPEALHTSLCVGFHFHRKYFTATHPQVVHLCIAALFRVLPIVHLWLLEAVAILLHFQSCEHLRCATLVYQIHVEVRLCRRCALQVLSALPVSAGAAPLLQLKSVHPLQLLHRQTYCQPEEPPSGVPDGVGQGTHASYTY